MPATQHYGVGTLTDPSGSAAHQPRGNGELHFQREYKAEGDRGRHCCPLVSACTCIGELCPQHTGFRKKSAFCLLHMSFILIIYKLTIPFPDSPGPIRSFCPFVNDVPRRSADVGLINYKLGEANPW